MYLYAACPLALQHLACFSCFLIFCSEEVASAAVLTGSVFFVQQTWLLSMEDEGRLPFSHTTATSTISLCYNQRSSKLPCSLGAAPQSRCYFSLFDLSIQSNQIKPEGFLSGGYVHQGFPLHRYWLQISGQGEWCISGVLWFWYK